MKKLFTFLVVILVSLIAFAQAPQKMSYQAVIRNGSDQLVKSQPVGMRVSILQGSITGTEVYKEIYNPNPQTNTNGLVTVEIGGGIPMIGTFSTIDWSMGTYFIKTELDPTGGTNYSIVGTSQLLSVPYAFYAKISGTSKDAVKISGDQTIAGIKTFTGTINASSQKIANVANPINAQDAATKFYVDAVQTQITMLKNTLKAGSLVIDSDGNPYNTVIIGTQTWMAENLKTTKYNDDSAIPNVTENNVWIVLTSGAYCWYNNDAATNKNLYGALYNWYAVNSGKLCPRGWHVPNDDEWKTLEIFMGMLQEEVDKTGAWRGTDQGIQIKNVTGWNGSYPIGTNAVGFTALPNGFRTYIIGDSWGLGEESAYWTSSFDENTNYGWYRSIVSYGDVVNSRIFRGTTVKTSGFSVRCVKDN